MALKDLYHRGELEGKSLKQIIAFTETGKFLDGNNYSSDFMEYLKIIPLSELEEHAKECLERNRSDFPDGSLALQDIVNDLGRKLDFKVTNGRYRGSKKKTIIGYDGAWSLYEDNGEIIKCIIVEVKKSDAFSLDIEKIDQYRQKFAKKKNIDVEKISILLVVGNIKPGKTRIVEGQIRGSRCAWYMRAIRVEALFKIAKSQETTDNSFDLIRKILIPQEYIVLDTMADMILSVSTDSSEESVDKSVDKLGKSAQQLTMEKVNKKLKEKLMLRRRSVFSTLDDEHWAVCYTSRLLHNHRFWFSISSKNKNLLDEKPSHSWLVLGCFESPKKPERIFKILWEKMADQIGKLNKNSNDRLLIEVRLPEKGKKKWYIQNPGGNRIDITKYLIKSA